MVPGTGQDTQGEAPGRGGRTLPGMRGNPLGLLSGRECEDGEWDAGVFFLLCPQLCSESFE